MVAPAFTEPRNRRDLTSELLFGMVSISDEGTRGMKVFTDYAIGYMNGDQWTSGRQGSDDRVWAEDLLTELRANFPRRDWEIRTRTRTVTEWVPLVEAVVR